MKRVAGSLILLASMSLAAAQNAPPPSFDVISIKRNTSGDGRVSWGIQPGGRWQMVNASIAAMIHDAYPTQIRELVNAPEWVTTERYDVEARASAQDAPPDQIRLMLRTLLAERVRLVVHEERREQPIFALVVARGDGRLGPAIKPMQIDCEAVNAARRTGRTPDAPQPSNGAAPCASRMSASEGATIMLGGLPLSRLADILSSQVERVVLDKTGLIGNYELTLRYSSPGTVSGDVPFVFTAVEEQLGLRLVPERASLPVLVVDRIARPTEN